MMAGPAGGASVAPAPYAVGERVFTFVDHSRLVRIPGRGLRPRTLVTVVRYPLNAPGPAGLIVFGHGFAVTPAYYYRLLQAWAAADYVVAAPVFPLANQHAPGGPDEADIVNQPRDMSFVISQMLALDAKRQSPLAGLIDPREIAVAGQSDGGETALAVAYDSVYRDPRVRAAIILAGARGLPGTYFQAGAPPLLAAQGTDDHIDRPRYTYAFFGAARAPKYLLKLTGAGHLPPFTYEQPQLSIVERVTVAFLRRYLGDQPREVETMISDGDVPGVSTLVADS
jgi:dienelactone hydrolase